MHQGITVSRSHWAARRLCAVAANVGISDDVMTGGVIGNLIAVNLRDWTYFLSLVSTKSPIQRLCISACVMAHFLFSPTVFAELGKRLVGFRLNLFECRFFISIEGGRRSITRLPKSAAYQMMFEVCSVSSDGSILCRWCLLSFHPSLI